VRVVDLTRLDQEQKFIVITRAVPVWEHHFAGL
jgi:hypothetical protein